MNESTHLEQDRLALQSRLDDAKTQEDRNRLGQFATPTRLARELVEYSIGLLKPNSSIRFFDPALGTGSFYSALRDVAENKKVAKAVGFEIDPHYGSPAKRLWANTPLRIEMRDFLAAEPPQKASSKFNLTICNPPYVRHHHIQNGEKVRLQEASETACGVRIAGLAGLYCYFLAMSHPWMSPGGVAAWLVPSEFMDVNYGAALKRYLITRVTLLRIHRFDPNDVQFNDALVSSAVVWLRNETPDIGHQVEFTFGGSLTQPKERRLVSADTLLTEHKWTRFPALAPRVFDDQPTLKDLFRIKRGLATGDNRFFIMTANQIADRDLPKEFFRPLLPSPRYIECDEIAANPDGSPAIERKLYLLDCRLPEDEVKSRYPTLWAYLLTGRSEVAERYLCRTRRPWYSQEDRPPPPFLCTYLGRSDKKNGRPFRFILNHSEATAANVYLLLYPRPVLANALLRDPGLKRKIWEFLNKIEPATLLGEGRVYGGGLHKLEPKELANVPVGNLLLAHGLRGTVPARQGELFVAA